MGVKKRRRIFIAINLPQDIKKYLAGFEKKWLELPAKWVSQKNIHITLVFLGYLTDEEIGEVCLTVKEVSQKHHSFSLTLNKISYGPLDKVAKRMVWVGGKKSNELLMVKKDLEKSLMEVINFKPEIRAFNHHINLARIKQLEFRALDIEERPEIDEQVDIVFSVESIEVMESVLKRTGPEYSIIELFQLN